MKIWKVVHKGLYVIGDGSGVTHSLSHASASGVYVARHILKKLRTSSVVNWLTSETEGRQELTEKQYKARIV